MRTTTRADHYGVLGLEPGASEEQIKCQYRRLAKVFHPDRNNDDVWCREQITKINLAYAALTGPDRRAVADDERVSWIAAATERPEEASAPEGLGGGLALPLICLSLCLAAYLATVLRALAPCLPLIHFPWLKP